MSAEWVEPLIEDPVTDTQRDPEIGSGNGSGNAGRASRAGANAHAGPRAHARGAEPDPVPDEPAETATLGERLAGWVGVFRPPEIWTDDRPALAKVAARAKRGEWTKADGAVRKAGVAYFRFVYVPTAAVTRYVDWLVERPSRLFVALAVLGLIVGAIWSYL